MPRGTAGPPSASTTCTLRGVSEPRINADIEDGQGHVVARFSGAATPLMVSDFPLDARGKVRVETGTGAGGFRIRGFLAVADLPLYSAVDVPVVVDHLWIAAGRPITFVASAPGRLRIEKRSTQPLAQTFSAWAPCNTLALAGGSLTAFTPAGNARGYVLKKTSLDLFDQPSGSLLTTLSRARDGDGVLFFSSEQRGDWISVEHHSDVVVQAWVRSKDLLALPPGESMDQLMPRTTQRSPARLAIQGEPRIVKPVREVPLRAAARENDAPIGVVEPGAETYVLDVVAGWASVMPKALNVVPGPEGQFWVKTSDLGI
ncbi:MAG: hypothetical protein QM756_28965 [Polyangiaceae bacterium]